MMSMRGNKNQSNETGSVNLIGNGTKIVGDIHSSGDLRIDGNLNGNLAINGKFVLGPSGLIEGNITCTNADIMGEVRGQVLVTELLQLKHTAKVNGDIKTGKLAIEPGAVFTGACDMGAKVKSMVQNHERVNATKTA